MSSPSDKPAVLFVLAELPGYAVPLAARMGERLRASGIEPVYLCGSPHYERFRQTDLHRIGATYYASDFLREHAHQRVELPRDFDRWWLHATFIRQRELVGEHLNAWESYGTIWNAVGHVFDRHPSLCAVWSEFPTNSLIAFACAHAERRGIPFLGYQAARVPGYFNVARDALGVEYIPNPEPPRPGPDWNAAPDYARLPMNTVAGQRWRDLLLPVLQRVPHMRWRPGEQSPEIGSPAVWQTRTTLKRFERKLRHSLVAGLHGVFDAVELDENRRNVLFPLHFRPEASTSVQARYYNEDLETLRNIAFSMPVDTTLFVKEHPAAVGVRPLSFYRRVAELPDTKLVAPEWPLRSHLQKLAAVIVLTSTVGFEALQAGVPVLLLGRTFYEGYPGVVRIRAWDELGPQLGRLTRPGPAASNPAVFERYATTCFPGRFSYMSADCLAEDNVEQLVQPLKRAASSSF